MSDLIHFLNGEFVPEEKLLVSPRDLGFGRGYAVSDFIVTYQNKPFKLTEHIDRLFRSAEIIALHIPWTKDQIAKWAEETLNKNDHGMEMTIKIIISGGVTHAMKQAPVPTLVMIVNPRQRQPPEHYIIGIKAIAVKYKR